MQKEDYRILWAASGFLTKKRYDILKKIFQENKTSDDFLKFLWEKLSPEILKKIGEKSISIDKFFDFKKNVSLEKQKKFLEKYDAEILFFEDEKFPKNLKNIPDCPMFLYVQGEILEDDFLSIAVVGARKISGYGKEIIKKIIPQLSEKLTIVSGLALGVDGMSHLEAMNAGGRTIGVIGSGLDIVYPSENAHIYKKILSEKKGAIISEFPFGTRPEKYNFPLRNRIVAGLTLGTLVIEAREKSGSLITANLAIDYNREVFAVPGSIFSTESGGTNSLIKKGFAKLISSSDDIFEELNMENKLKIKKVQIDFEGDEIEEKIFLVLGNVGKVVDKIAIETGLSVREVSSKLVLMEMKGFVMENESGSFVRLI
ncbi:DNA-processing protein DprA [Candidatus Gracilibacteria bacterium]|nr:DNA-processing protein DprA [Candidatus Gracilibacteria bacterium]